jgi:hypothetical protein
MLANTIIKIYIGYTNMFFTMVTLASRMTVRRSDKIDGMIGRQLSAEAVKKIPEIEVKNTGRCCRE